MTRRIAKHVIVNLLSIAGIIAGILTWWLTTSIGWGIIGGLIMTVIGLMASIVLCKLWQTPVVIVRFVTVMFGRDDGDYANDAWKKTGVTPPDGLPPPF